MSVAAGAAADAAFSPAPVAKPLSTTRAKVSTFLTGQGHGLHVDCVWKSLEEAGLKEEEWLDTLECMGGETLAQLVAAAAVEYPSQATAAQPAPPAPATTDPAPTPGPAALEVLPALPRDTLLL
jgi:hypothetical protein